eukprot:6092171-Prymnesium_polylepis.1
MARASERARRRARRRARGVAGVCRARLALRSGPDPAAPHSTPSSTSYRARGVMWTKGDDVTDPPWGGSNRMMGVFRSWGACLDTLVTTYSLGLSGTCADSIA